MLGRRLICLRWGDLLSPTRHVSVGWRGEGGRGVALRLFPGLPKRIFFSVAAFLGGIFFLRRVEEVEKKRRNLGDGEGEKERGKGRRRNSLDK